MGALRSSRAEFRKAFTVERLTERGKVGIPFSLRSFVVNAVPIALSERSMVLAVDLFIRNVTSNDVVINAKTFLANK